MANSVSRGMATNRYSQSVVRAHTESSPDVDVCYLTPKPHEGGSGPKLVLPLPVNVGSNTGTSWEHADAGLTAHLVQGKPITETMVDMFRTGAAEVDRKALTMLSAGVFGEAGDAAYQKRTGALINPAKENFFRGSNARDIQLTFNLIPINASETLTYKEIIFVLQKYSVPSVPGGNLGRLMKYPASWSIEFNPARFLPKYKDAALTNITVDYSATGKTYLHEGGGPVQINLSLSFTEMTVLTREDVDGAGIYG